MSGRLRLFTSGDSRIWHLTRAAQQRAETAKSQVEAAAATVLPAAQAVSTQAAQVAQDRQAVSTAAQQAEEARLASLAQAGTATAAAEQAQGILNATAAAAEGTTYAANLGALTTAMAADPVGARGEVLPPDAAEGIYTKTADGLVRTGDTARQISQRFDIWRSITASGRAMAFTARDAQGRRRKLGAARLDGTWEMKRLEVDHLQVANPTFPVLTTFETLRDLSRAIPIVTPQRRILGYIPRTMAGFGGGGAGTSTPIEELSPGIDQAGATDMSTQVEAAHALALSRRIRYVNVPGRVLAPSAERIGEVIWIGTGELVGNRRRVVPAHAGRARPEPHTLIATVHLPQFLARLATATPENPVRWVVTGDSWTELRQGVSGVDWWVPMLRAELRRQLGPLANRVVVIDRGVGGMNWPQLANQTMAGKPSKAWAPDTSRTILSYLQDADGDVYSINLGQNDWQSGGFSRASMLTAIAAIRGFARTPEIVLGLTAARCSQDTPDNGLQAGQVLYDRVAGGMRTWALRNGVGYWDFAAHLNALRDGDLVTDPIYRQVQTDAAITLPWTAASAAHDWSFRLTSAAGGAFWETGDRTLTITLSPREGNVLRLDRDADTGNLAWSCDARTGSNIVPRTVTDTPAVDGTALNLEVTVRGGQLVVTTLDPLRGAALAIEAPIEREGGEHAPVVSFGGGGSVAVTLSRRTVGEPRLFMPQHTNRQAYGVNAFGGNAAAHGTSVQFQDGIAEVLRTSRLGP